MVHYISKSNVWIFSFFFYIDIIKNIYIKKPFSFCIYKVDFQKWSILGFFLQHDWYLTSATGLWLFTTPVFIYTELVNKHTCTSLNVFSVSVSFFPWTNCTCIGKALLRRRKKKIFIQRLYNFKTVLKKSNFYLEQNCIENSEKLMQLTRSHLTFIWWKLIGLGWWNSN